MNHDYCPTNQTLEAAQKEKELKQVSTFSYYMSNVIPDFDRIAGDSYDALSDVSKKCIDNAIVRYMEWQSKQQPIKSEQPIDKVIEFAEWIGEQGLFCGLSPDNVRRWHKLIGNSKPYTTKELYEQYINQNKEAL